MDEDPKLKDKPEKDLSQQIVEWTHQNILNGGLTLNINPLDAINSKFFGDAKKRAESYTKEEAKKVFEEAEKKADETGGPKGPLAEVWDDLMALFRMLKAYFDGEYPRVPWEAIAIAIASLLYFLLPTDLIIDLIPGLGYVDDAAVLGFAISAIHAEIQVFKAWEDAKSGVQT